MCIKLEKLAPIFYCSSVVFSSLLFFFRAVFSTYPWIIAFFALLWVAVLAGCLPLVIYSLKPTQALPPGPPPSNIPICYNGGIDPYAAAATIIPLINDTLVFVAITWRLSLNSYEFSYTFHGWHEILILWWLRADILQGITTRWTGLLLVKTFLNTAYY